MVKVAEIVRICNYKPYHFSISFRRHVKGLTFAGFQNLSRYPVEVSGPWGARKFVLPPGKLVAAPISSWGYAGTAFCFNRPCRIKLFAGYIVRKGEKPVWTDYRIVELGKTLKVEAPSVQPTLGVDLPKSVKPGEWVEATAHIGTKPLAWNRYLYFAVQNLSSEPVYIRMGRQVKLNYGDMVTARSPTHQPGWQCKFEMMFPNSGKYEILFLSSCGDVWGDAMTWYLNVVAGQPPSQPPTQPPSQPPTQPPAKPPKIPVNDLVLGAITAGVVLGGVYAIGKMQRWW